MSELAELVVRTLTERDRTLATCESLTGGLLGATVTGVPGASKVYRGGLVTYATDLKVSLAGVSEDFVSRHGVINEQTASEMALSAMRRLQASFGLGCTGVAGPDAQDGERPGLVWIALAIDLPGADDRVVTRRLDLQGDREAIRRTTVEACLQLLVDTLKPVA